MSARSTSVALAAAAVLLCACPLVRGQAGTEELERVFIDEEVGIAKCKLASCDATRKWRDECVVKPPPSQATCNTAGVELLVEARSRLLELGGGGTRVAATVPGIVEPLKLPRGVNASASSDAAALEALRRNLAFWRFDSPGRMGREGAMIDLMTPLDADCASAGVCKAATEQAAEIATLVRRVEFVLTQFQSQADGDFAAHFALLDKMWTNYFSGTRDQWPWELWSNSRIYKNEGLQGLRRPPTWQLIWGHPAVGYEYAGGSGDNFEESLQLEIIGFYRWRWGDDGSMHDRFGASVTLNFSDRSDAKRAGIGFLLHFKQGFSVGASTRSRDGGGHLAALVFSYDLGKTVQDKLKTVREFVAP